jgi:parallel beta-helix repeat protein/predicted outer membrane repeat protein
VANPTTIDAQGLGRVFFLGAGSDLISPTLSGLRITHGDGTGLGGHAWNANWDMGGGIYALSASVTISNNWVLDNATLFCGGLMIIVGSITVEGNTISGNQCGSGRAGGLCVAGCSGTIQGNTLSDNVSQYAGGGMLVYVSDVTLEGNSFISNSAGDKGGAFEVAGGTVTLLGNTFISNTAGSQGGVMHTGIDYGAGVITLTGNTFLSNTAGSQGGALYVEGLTNTVTLEGNTFSGNTALSGGAVYLNQIPAALNGNTILSNRATYGSGLYLYLSSATLDGNTIANNTAQSNGGGLFLTGSDPTLNGNTIANNTAQSNGGGLYLVGNSNPLLTNNLVADNQAEGFGSGLYASYSSPTLLHNTIARNTGGDGSGLHLAGSSTVALSNTVLVSHTVGITVTANATAVLEATLWGSGAWGNASDWGGDGTIVTGTVNLWADPAFVDPDMGDYHISTNSAAVDAGVDSGVADDIDGDPRPIGPGYDIGADEARSCGFEVYEGNPVMEPGPPGAWDSDFIWGRALVYTDGVYYFFYGGTDDYQSAPFSIGLATSTNGLDFSKYPDPIMTGDGTGFDAVSVLPSEVRLEGDTWTLYYGGTDDFYVMGSPGLATATNPLGPWTRLDDPVLDPGPAGEWDSAFVGAGSIVPTEDGYLMYYTGGDDISPNAIIAIGLATSTNGIDWTKYDDPSTPFPPYAYSDPVLKPGPPGSWDGGKTYGATVFATPWGYEAFYSANSTANWFRREIGYAVSPDGIDWTARHPDNPILQPEDDPVAWMIIESPKVLLIEETYWMYYDYYNSPNAVGLARGKVCCAPVEEASIAGPALLLPGETGYYTATYSPLGATPPVTLTWDSGAVGPTAAYSWTDPGDYTITVTAANPCGEVGGFYAVTVCDPVTILSVTTAISGCVVDFGAELTGTAPFAYDWDFGLFGSSSAPTPTVDFVGDGTYPYTLTAYNCGGAGWDSLAGEVTVSCGITCAPVTNTLFTWVPLTPTVSQTVTFSASAEGTPPIAFSWAFGDGMTGMGQVITHSYGMAGTYTVTLTATNCVTATQTVVHTIPVLPVPPPEYRIYLPVVVKGY